MLAVINGCSRPQAANGYKRNAWLFLFVLAIFALSGKASAQDEIRMAQAATSTTSTSSSPSSSAIMTCGSQAMTCTAASCMTACSSQESMCQLNCLVPGMTPQSPVSSVAPPVATLSSNAATASQPTTGPNAMTGGAMMVPAGGTPAVGQSATAANPATPPTCFASCISEQLACQSSCAGLASPSQSSATTGGSTTSSGPMAPTGPSSSGQ